MSENSAEQAEHIYGDAIYFSPALNVGSVFVDVTVQEPDLNPKDMDLYQLCQHNRLDMGQAIKYYDTEVDG